MHVLLTVEEHATAEEAKNIIHQFNSSWTDGHYGAYKTAYFPNILLADINHWVAVKAHQNTDKTGCQ